MNKWIIKINKLLYLLSLFSIVLNGITLFFCLDKLKKNYILGGDIMKRKLLTVLTLLVSIFCSTTIYAISADNPEYFDGNYSNGELVNGEVVFEEKDSSESMEIATTKERIDRYGNFTFDIGYSVLSNEFTVSKNNFQIWTNARIENPNGKDVTSKYPGHRYSIELLKKQH